MSRAPIETRPSTAQWLIAEREAAGFTNAPDFLAAVKAKMGKAPSYSTYASWESGAATPRASNLKVIREYHAQREGSKGLPATSAPDLPAALALLAAAVSGMATELGALRQERERSAEQLEALGRANEALARRLAALEAGASSAPRAPRAKAG